MSCESKKEWVKMPSVNTPCVLEVAKDATEQHNKASGDHLVFKKVISGWFWEIDDNTIKHRLYIEVTNSKGVVLIYEIVIVVEQKNGKRVRTLISSNPGYPDEKNPFIFWIRIPNVNQQCVQENSKWAVAEYNKTHHDYLVYISTTEGWYQEVNPYAIRFKLYIKVKECIGRERYFCAVVREDKPLTEKIRTLEGFYPIPKKH